jgi:hypothetical protein
MLPCSTAIAMVCEAEPSRSGPPEIVDPSQDAVASSLSDAKLARRVFVVTVTYAGGRTQQFSVRRERVAEVRR